MLHLLPETGLYRPNPKSNLYSVAIHAGAIALLLLVASTHPLPNNVKPAVHLSDPINMPLLKPYHAGGGGGARDLLPADKGRLPRVSNRQFVPPEAVPQTQHPLLPMEPTIIAPPDAVLPQVNLLNYGDPLAKLGLHSNGPGSNGGIGDGKNNGVGDRTGPGFGPEPGGGVGGIFTIGVGGVTAPEVIHQVEPQYSEEARKAKLSGVVILDLVVDPNGLARNINVVHGAGLGLDEKAIEAVRLWRFKPGAKSGKPVPVHARVEVNFRLL